jgi:murein DD-endopeptidase MepM/ murein hydrolase activator NlpD
VKKFFGMKSLFLALLGTLVLETSSLAAPFTYDPPGTMVPAKAGRGRVDAKVYVPGMRFPTETANAFANSQVYGRGGSMGGGGAQCDAVNYAYPWHDNYCEIRSWSMPLCPSGKGHQGQDIRPSTCEKSKHWAVAAASGRITSIGSYSVYLTSSNGTRFDYLHMSNVQVTVGQTVTRGQRLGKVSNVFGSTATTIHLHFNIRQTLATVGAVYVPPYTSLIDSYKRLLSPGTEPDAGPVTSDAGEEPDADIVIINPPDEPEPVPAEEDLAAEALPPSAPPSDGGCGCVQAGVQTRSGEWLLAMLAFAPLLARGRKRSRKNV